jgi:hypothetical protein
LLVGASFSLWRAVFLLDADRASEKIADNALKFLRKFLQDNTIAYQTDRDRRDWSVGYYLNNARYRIERIGEHAGYEDTLADDDLSRSIIGLEPEKVWDECYAVLEKQLSRFADRTA